VKDKSLKSLLNLKNQLFPKNPLNPKNLLNLKNPLNPLIPLLEMDVEFYLFIGVDFLEDSVDNLLLMMFMMKLLMLLWLSLMPKKTELYRMILCLNL